MLAMEASVWENPRDCNERHARSVRRRETGSGWIFLRRNDLADGYGVDLLLQRDYVLW
jgi:hypothetical protein